MGPELSEVPVLVINLPRRTDRRANVTKFVQSLGLGPLHWVDSCDGEALLLGGGRARRVPNRARLTRLTYDVDGERTTHLHKCSKLSVRVPAAMWGEHACAMSHLRALEVVVIVMWY